MADLREPITSKCSLSSTATDARPPLSATNVEVVIDLQLARSRGLEQDLSLETMLERLRLLNQVTIPAAGVVNYPSTEYDGLSTELSSALKRQQSSDVKDVTDMEVVQPLVEELGLTFLETGNPTPATVLGARKHEQSAIRGNLDTDENLDSDNLEVTEARSSIRGGRSLADSDMPGYIPTMASSVVVHRNIEQEAEGHLENVAATGYKSLELRRKKPETKRKRVPKSAQISSLNKNLSVSTKYNSALRVVAEASPLPLATHPAQVNQWTPTKQDIRQQPGKDLGAPSVSALQYRNHPQPFNGKVSGRLNGKDNRGVEGPDTQVDWKTSKSKWRKPVADVYIANKWGKNPGHQVPVTEGVESNGRNTNEQMITKGDVYGAGDIDNKIARQTPCANPKKFPFRKQQRQPTLAFVKQFDGKGDAPYEVLAQSDVRETETFTSPSFSHQNKQHKLSSRHLHYSDPISEHTDRKFHRSANTIIASPQTPPKRTWRAERTDPARYEMSTSRRATLGGRGRLQVKSSNEDEKFASSHWPSRTPSVASNGTGRRSRGFQPAEVGKSKPNNPSIDVTSAVKEGATQSRNLTTPQQSSLSPEALVTSSSPSKADILTTHQEPVRDPALPKAESFIENMDEAAPAISDVLDENLLMHTPEKQSQIIADCLAKAISRKSSTLQEHDLSPKANGNSHVVPEGATMDLSRLKHDQAHVEPSETSSIEVVVNDEPQQSYWSKAINTQTPTPQKPDWDNSSKAVDGSSWLDDSLLPTPDHKAPVPANLRNVDPGLFTRSERTKATSDPKRVSTIAASSSPFQKADHVNSKHQLQLPHTPQALPSKPSPTPQQATSMNPTIPQPDRNDEVAKQAAKLPPHLKAKYASSHATTGNGNTQHTNVARKTVEAMAKYTTPLHLQSQPTKGTTSEFPTPSKHSPAGHPEVPAALPEISIDEEVAAAGNTVNTENDAKIAATLAVEDPHGDQQFAAALQADYDEQQIFSKQWRIDHPDNDHADNSLPPHLKASKQKQKQEAPADEPKSRNLPSATSQAVSVPQDNYTIAVATHSGALKDVTHLRQNAKVQNIKVSQNGHESAKKQGKKPVMAVYPDEEPSILADWNGTLLPPPMGEDWNNRRQHHSSEEKKIEAIKYWAEEHVDNSGVELQEEEEHFDHPVTKTNPDEFNMAKRHLKTDDHIQAYKAKQLSSVGDSTPSSRGRPATKEEKREARKRQAKDQAYEAPVFHNEHAAAANIYLRPAQFKDMKQVCFLHNHYILKTPLSYHLEEKNEVYWRERLQEAANEADPFLVAVLMGSTRIKSLKDVRPRTQETIVGFALAADYGLQDHVWRFTVELEMWVHPEHLHQGIGRSLLDRMLGALDSGYNLKECAPFLDDSDQRQRWSGGSHSLVKTILVNMLDYQGRTAAVEWKKHWLSEKHDFKHCGTIPGIGRRNGKDVDMTQMVLRTSSALPMEVCYTSS